MSRCPMLFAIALTCCATVGGHSPGPRASFRLGNTVDLGDIQEDSLMVSLGDFNRAAKVSSSVTLRIDSPGGSVFAGYKWLREMEDVKKRRGTRVTCVVDGLAASMAAVILESPLCDERLATTRSLLLFHNGSSGARGTAEELKATATLLDAINESMALVVSGRLGIPTDAYRAKIATGDWVMAVTEALNVHALDGLVDPSEIAPPLVLM